MGFGRGGSCGLVSAHGVEVLFVATGLELWLLGWSLVVQAYILFLSFSLVSLYGLLGRDLFCLVVALSRGPTLSSLWFCIGFRLWFEVE